MLFEKYADFDDFFFADFPPAKYNTRSLIDVPITFHHFDDFFADFFQQNITQPYKRNLLSSF